MLGRRAPLAYREMAGVYQRYEQEKRQRRMIDFDDLLRLCRRDLREDREFAQAQHWRYQHLFVDEFQDVNPLQRSLLDAWVAGRDDLCVVGDPNQAIYAWNGADPSTLADFADPAPRRRDRAPGRQLPVEPADPGGGQRRAGRRCARQRGGRPGPSARSTPTDPTGRSPPSPPAPTTSPRPGPSPGRCAITTRPGGSWSTQAVLCRTNAQVAVLEQALHKAGIPFRVRGGGGLLDQPEVKVALRELQRHEGDLSAALADLLAAARTPTVADRDGDLELDLPPPAGGSSADDRHRRGQPCRQPRGAGPPRPRLPGGRRPALDRRLPRVAPRDDPGRPARRQGDAVELATFHAAKGLEWPIVHLAGLEQGLVPIGHARTADDLAEERRLFYVAITRGRAGAALHLGREPHLRRACRGPHPSPYLDEVEIACQALQAGETPADWVAHLSAQRAALRAAAPVARARRGGARRGASGGSAPGGATTSTRSARPRSRR